MSDKCFSVLDIRQIVIAAKTYGGQDRFSARFFSHSASTFNSTKSNFFFDFYPYFWLIRSSFFKIDLQK